MIPSLVSIFGVRLSGTLPDLNDRHPTPGVNYRKG
jgi:hypothetical protein